MTPAILVAVLVAVTACSTAKAGRSPSAAVTATPTSDSSATRVATTSSDSVSGDPESGDSVSTDPGTTADSDPRASTDSRGSSDPYGTTDPYGTDPYGTAPQTTETQTSTGLEPTDPPTIATAQDSPGPIPSSTLDPNLPNLHAAFAELSGKSAALSVTVWRDHAPVFAQAAGLVASGQPVTTDTPMVLASVSKLVTSLTITRLAEADAIEVDAPVPWDVMNIAHDPSWNDVTVRELLDHTSGMPKAQSTWLNDPGSCSIPLTAAMAGPPINPHGQWRYSNGNYCALGLLIEAVTGVDRGTAARAFVFDPIDVSGPHLTTDGQLPGDGPYAKGLARLDRLGGAGTWMAASDDIAAMLDSVTDTDSMTMTYPAIMVDQYGWGHTGTVDGAKACAWVMDQGRTVVVGIVAGERPSTGGMVCDALVPALAADLGIWADKPHRLPE